MTGARTAFPRRVPSFVDNATAMIEHDRITAAVLSVDEVAREVQAYAMARLPQAEPAHAMAAAGAGDRKDWGIIEID